MAAGAAALSGAAALGYETTFLRRLSVVVGGSATASALTLAAFMLGLGAGGALSGRFDVRRPARTYAMLEGLAALSVFVFPFLLPFVPGMSAAWLVVPTAALLGATWPVLVRGLTAREAVSVYAANTFGAVAGVILTTFLTLPTFGIRGAEGVSMALGISAAVLAASVDAPTEPVPVRSGRRPGAVSLALAFTTGFVALGLEVVWMRLASVGLGATVQTIGLVLAVFLTTLALGSAIGRSERVDPERAVWWGAGLLGLLAVAGGFTFPLVPYGVAIAYDYLGPEGIWLGHVVLSALWMGGAPLASGFTFACLTRMEASRSTVGEAASWLYAVNTLGSTLGALAVGLWMLPVLEPRTTLLVLSTAVCVLAVGGAWWSRGPVRSTVGLFAAVGVAGVVLPAWDARLYAVGVHLAVSDFASRDVASIRQYADGDWELLSYDHGWTAAVAVGRSKSSGNVWLSINGKFDASTGADMPTQILSGELPVAIARRPARVAVVGLASGVTAGAVLRSDQVERMDVFELEPAVVAASHAFDHVNGRPLEDPRTWLFVEDARAALGRGGLPYDVIISEPSNPWITGVSSLFTLEYWQTARGRLSEGGVFCQWVQLYGLGPDAFRALVRTYVAVFGDVWLYETIDGSDILLIAGPPPTGPLPLQPRLDPDGVRRLAGMGWLNTDDHPRIEWEAPRWLHYATADDNAALIEAAATALPRDRPRR